MALTDEEIEREKEFLAGLPRLNIGAFLLPPVWGPGHGLFITVLWYPIWLFADNMFYAAYSHPSPLSIVIALITLVSLTAGTVAFGILSQPYAAHRADNKGVSRETYLKRERRWAIGCAIAGIIMIVLATIYNIVIRPTISW